MKLMPSIAVVSLSLLGLAACTSAGTKSAYVAPATVEHATSQQVRTVQDSNYVVEVESIARQRGVQVHWINPPTKRIYATR